VLVGLVFILFGVFNIKGRLKVQVTPFTFGIEGVSGRPLSGGDDPIRV